MLHVHMHSRARHMRSRAYIFLFVCLHLPGFIAGVDVWCTPRNTRPSIACIRQLKEPHHPYDHLPVASSAQATTNRIRSHHHI
jgi:hypothetical protein